MLKKISAMAIIAASVVAISAPAQAASGRSIEQVYKECGLGGVIFGNSSAILAIISNVTWDLGTTAALSDSLSPDTCISPSTKAAVFIKETFPTLEKDLAAGQGQHIAALSTIMSCPTASKAIRQDYARYTTTASYNDSNTAQNAEQLFQIVSRNMETAGCSAS
jgi:hypothetical protein